jgi:hypothetical protein
MQTDLLERQRDHGTAMVIDRHGHAPWLAVDSKLERSPGNTHGRKARQHGCPDPDRLAGDRAEL